MEEKIEQLVNDFLEQIRSALICADRDIKRQNSSHEG